GQAQLRAAGGYGVSWQESSIRVFVLAYFTSEQGRHFLPVLFSFGWFSRQWWSHAKAAPAAVKAGDGLFPFLWVYHFAAANSAASTSHSNSCWSISSKLPTTTWWVQRLG